MSQTKVLAAKNGVTLKKVTLHGPGGVAVAQAFTVSRPDTPEVKNFEDAVSARRYFDEAVSAVSR